MNNDNPKLLLEEKIESLITLNSQLIEKIEQFRQQVALRTAENKQLKAVNTRLYEDNARLAQMRQNAFRMIDSLKHGLTDPRITTPSDKENV
jgi:hypothetical protein